MRNYSRSRRCNFPGNLQPTPAKWPSATRGGNRGLLQIGNNEPSNLAGRSFPRRPLERNFLNERAIRNAPNPTPHRILRENLKPFQQFFPKERKSGERQGNFFEIEQSDVFLLYLQVLFSLFSPNSIFYYVNLSADSSRVELSRCV